jgi:hypothetical protein
MHIEIDQSGEAKMDKGGYTILAFSNKVSAAYLFPARVKRECRVYLERRAKTKRARQTYYLKLFATGIVLLIKDYLPQIQSITIDVEWEGQESNIKSLIIEHLKKLGFSFPAKEISFRRIGKGSRAHEKAYRVHRALWEGKGSPAPDRTVTTQELLNLLK